MTETIYVTDNITLQDILAGRICEVEVLKRIVTNWFLAPARHLAEMKQTVAGRFENGMSLFALELMFFEPHGQYLSGEDSAGHAAGTFRRAFERFRQWLLDNGRVSETFGAEQTKNVWTRARCGLFHSGHIRGGLLIDIRRTEHKPFYENPSWEGWLVDPWELLSDLENYFSSYIEVLESPSHPEHCTLYDPFSRTFKRMVVEPLCAQWSGR